jgi:NodT family efflux transporter outer membrane factor (OMF) lipoprotein
MYKKLILLVVLLTIFGCSTGAKLDKSKINSGINLPAKFYGGGSTVVDNDMWWYVFGSTELNKLMDNMLKANIQLSKSYEGLKALQASLGISNADRLPTVNAGLKASETYSQDMAGKRKWRDGYELSLTASYEADIWGRIKSGTEASRQELIATQYDVESLYMTLTAELADRYFIYKGLAGVLKMQAQQLELRQKQISALEMMYSSGVGNLDAVYMKQTAIANLLNDMESTKKSMSDAQVQIARLIGMADYKKITITDKYDFNVPVLPKVIPSDVARQRPDIKSAYADVEKSNATLAQAMANRYPKLSFTAGLSYSGSELNKLISPENFVANLVGNLVMPLFDANKRKLQVQQQEYLLQQQIYNYYDTTLSALSEVSRALSDNVQKSRALKLSGEKVKIEEKRLQIAEMKYELGIKDYSDVIDNKISLLGSWIAELNARRSLFSARIELARAAGGNWAGELVKEKLAATYIKENK